MFCMLSQVFDLTNRISHSMARYKQPVKGRIN